MSGCGKYGHRKDARPSEKNEVDNPMENTEEAAGKANPGKGKGPEMEGSLKINPEITEDFGSGMMALRRVRRIPYQRPIAQKESGKAGAESIGSSHAEHSQTIKQVGQPSWISALPDEEIESSPEVGEDKIRQHLEKEKESHMNTVEKAKAQKTRRPNV